MRRVIRTAGLPCIRRRRRLQPLCTLRRRAINTTVAAAALLELESTHPLLQLRHLLTQALHRDAARWRRLSGHWPGFSARSAHPPPAAAGCHGAFRMMYSVQL
jgi:hypothetical protein